MRSPLSLRFAFLLAATAVAAAAAPSPAAAAAQEPPAPRHYDDLVEEYLGHDGRTEAGFAARAEILARFALVEPLKPSLAKKWRKNILKAAAEGRELDKGERRQHWWPDEERGLFLVGGETRKPKGVLVAMHGGGAGSGDAEEAFSAYRSAGKELGWVVIAPQVLELTEHGWTDSGTEEFVVDLIAAALRTWKIDRDKVFLAGHSMGGYGSWTIGAHHADLVAGLAPSAGAPTPYVNRAGEVTGIADGVVPNLHNVPLVVFQSRDDPRVPPDANDAAIAELKKVQKNWGGYPFEYWEVDRHGHSYPPGGMIAHLEKIAEHARVAVPERIVWEPRLAWKRQFYWLSWTAPPRQAFVVATRDVEANAIHLEADRTLAGLEVLLDERVVDPKRPITITVNGEEVWQGSFRVEFETLLLTGAHGDEARMFAMRVPVAPAAE